MTKQELIDLMDGIVSALEFNRDNFPAEILDKAESLVYKYNTPQFHASVGTISGVSPQEVKEYFEKALKAIQVQKDLVKGDLTNKIVSGINNFKDRPMMLSILAGLI